MKVLMFGWEFPPHITGGLGTACFGLTQGLIKNDVDILFVIPKTVTEGSEKIVQKEEGNKVQDQEKQYLATTNLIDASKIPITTNNYNYKRVWENITYLESGVQLVPYLSPEQYTHFINEFREQTPQKYKSAFGNTYRFSGGYGPDLFEEVEKFAQVGALIASSYEFDVIHAHDWLTFAAGAAAKEVSGKPMIAHVHATEFDRSGENTNPNVFELEKKGLEVADKVIAVSELTGNIITEKYGIPSKKVATVHNAVLPRESEGKPKPERHLKEKIVTFLGRITFQKGPEYFVEAANIILQHDPNVRFVMAGSGDMLHKMIKRVAKLRISSKFHFTGFLRGSEVDQMFGLTDVYVMPSVSEPFGISPLEAIRSDIPVIISQQSGVSEILNHALKVNFWDVQALADAIYGLLNYPPLSEKFIQNGKKEVENLKWEQAAAKVKNIYQELIKPKDKIVKNAS